MSKNLIIKEFATDKTLNSIKKVVTRRKTSSDIDWVAEDDCKLIEKTFTNKGTYKASDYNAYGFSKVTVNIPKSKNAEKEKEEKHKTITPSVTIMEGDVGKKFSGIKKLRIKKTNNDYSLWIPERNVELTTKSIRGNETFVAEKCGAYGFSKVTITSTNKKKTVTKDDGNEYSQDVDDDDNPILDDEGNPIECKIPSTIQIITPPTKTVYNDGEKIDLSGIVVKAYYGDGSEWGIVDKDELTKVPETAIALPGDKYSDGHGINAVKISTYETTLYCENDSTTAIANPTTLGVVPSYKVDTSGQIIGSYDVPMTLRTNNAVPSEYLITQYNGAVYAALISGGNYPVIGYWLWSPLYGGYWYPYSGSTSSRVGESFLPIISPSEGILNNIIPESTTDPYGKNKDTLAPISDSVTVKWQRPEDNKTLTDDFEIGVNPANNENNTGGGGSSW